uniref:Uncharacterized protein n=1 Tax=Anguilla anguilla TaxID=7936 RepID=A0A0E9U942_ANGAN
MMVHCSHWSSVSCIPRMSMNTSGILPEFMCWIVGEPLLMRDLKLQHRSPVTPYLMPNRATPEQKVTEPSYAPLSKSPGYLLGTSPHPL